MNAHQLALIIEILGISVGSIGIGVEIATNADIGHVLITCGTTLIAVGSIIYAKIFKWLG